MKQQGHLCCVCVCVWGGIRDNLFTWNSDPSRLWSLCGEAEIERHFQNVCVVILSLVATDCLHIPNLNVSKLCLSSEIEFLIDLDSI